MIVIFGSIFNGDIGGGVTFTQYFVTGMIASGLMATGFQALAIQIPIERDRGVLKRLRGTPMPRCGLLHRQGRHGARDRRGRDRDPARRRGAALRRRRCRPPAAKWLTFAWVGLLGITACTLCGIAFSSVARTGRSAPAVVTPVALVLQFISGVFFVFTELPPWMQQVAALFPLKWMCQGMRSVFLPDSFARQEAGRLLGAGQGRAGAGRLVRRRPGAVPDDVPLDDQARRLTPALAWTGARRR